MTERRRRRDGRGFWGGLRRIGLDWMRYELGYEDKDELGWVGKLDIGNLNDDLYMLHDTRLPNVLLTH